MEPGEKSALVSEEDLSARWRGQAMCEWKDDRQS
jgi:hypothetical protein